ncbi:hypothetical protein EDD11_005056 [Mortierella claussenii]|nr:hypothetical protein EDD11_005056 [Mortierella claussenii]
MFNGYDWHGRRIEVREDKFGPPAGGSSRDAGHGGHSSLSSRYDPPARDYGRGGDSYAYGNGGGGRGGRSGHDMYSSSGSSRFNDHRAGGDINMADVPSGPAADSAGGAGGDQILIRNLPLTTTGQDLKDLFRTCGPIRMTEMFDSAGRSKGSGIVRFEMYESANKAVSRFNGYVYGGRSLEVKHDRA